MGGGGSCLSGACAPGLSMGLPLLLLAFARGFVADGGTSVAVDLASCFAADVNPGSFCFWRGTFSCQVCAGVVLALATGVVFVVDVLGVWSLESAGVVLVGSFGPPVVGAFGVPEAFASTLVLFSVTEAASPLRVEVLA